MAYRCDTSIIAEVQRTPAGGYRVPATIARSCVLSYPWGKEYVPQSTLDASVGQLAGLPVSLGHPPERMVDAKNYSKRNIGHVDSGASVDDKGQHVAIYVQRHDAIEAVESGSHRQVSAGYDTKLDKTPGVAPDGERYDAIQTGRTYNHIAIVKRARGGSELAIRLDEHGDMIEDDPSSDGMEIFGMKRKVRIDGVDHEVEAPESFFQALDVAEGTRAGELKTAVSRADTAEGELVAVNGKLTEATTRLDEAIDPARLDERVKERTEIETKARAVLGAEVDFAGKTDREVMEATIRTDEKEDFSKSTDDFIKGMFLGRTKNAKPARREDSLDRVRKAALITRQASGVGRNDSDLSVVEAARQRRLQEDSKGYKLPLAVSTQRGGAR